MTKRPLCSIIINNYNYGEYVGAAIESALQQTYTDIEVIVVDDGSTDNSREVISRYGKRIHAVFKENGGQSSAINAGWKLCQGDIVIFLDSDDVLFPDHVERIVAAWNDDVATVHSPVQMIAKNGQPLPGRIWPPRPGPDGDVVPVIARFGLYISPPTSGNAFSRRVLMEIMPIPQHIVRNESDEYLVPMAALRGRIVVLREPGVGYRQHGRNISIIGLKVMARAIRRHFGIVQELYDKQPTPAVLTAPPPLLWPQHLKYRIVARLLKPLQIPELKDIPQIQNDSQLRLCWSLIRSSWAWPGYHFGNRVGVVVWAAIVNLLPLSMIMRLTLLANAGHMGRVFNDVRQSMTGLTA